jgi:hypothetical protein
MKIFNINPADRLDVVTQFHGHHREHVKVELEDALYNLIRFSFQLYWNQSCTIFEVLK